jgi:hypothetical protein
VIESASTLVQVTTHALERAIGRGVAESDDGIDRVAARAMLDHGGLIVLGRALLSRGDLDWPDTFAVPFEDGLVLGAFHPVGEGGRDRLVYDGGGRFPHSPPPSPLVTDDPWRDGGKPCAYRGATVLGPGEMTATQRELQSALVRFVSSHRAVVNRLGEACLWPDTAIRPGPGSLVGGDAWTEALDALRLLAHDPALRLRDGGRPVRLSRTREGDVPRPPDQRALASAPSERTSSSVSSTVGAFLPSTVT